MTDWREPFLAQIDPAQVVFNKPEGIILCADCRHILPTFPKDSVDLVLTDPPYGVDIDKWDKWQGLQWFNLVRDNRKEKRDV